MEKHLNKEELEKLKVGNQLKCKLLNLIDPSTDFYYYLEIKSIKLGRNGYRIRTQVTVKPNSVSFENQVQNLFHLPIDYHDIICNFTINGAFSKDGIHNPGKNYLKRKYYLV